MLKGQYILTTHQSIVINNQTLIPKLKIGDYNLYYDEVELTTYKQAKDEFYLLGYLYDWEHPAKTNYDILEDIYQWRNIDWYSGHFILISKVPNEFRIINDCCAQYQIFYDSTFNVIASQPILIKQVIDCKPENDYYKSMGIYAGNETQYTNVKQLIPNHYIDIIAKKVIRFFPIRELEKNPLSFIVPKATEMIKGYLKAAALRKKLIMTLTGGYDTRLLFGATKDTTHDYFVLKTQYMEAGHRDIQISIRIIDKYKKNLKIISSDRVNVEDHKDIYGDEIRRFIDCPLLIYENLDEFKDCQVVTGSLSEIFRGFWDNYYFVNPKILAYLAGFKNNKYAIDIYTKWIKNEFYGYSIIDMFFWEEKCPNYVSKINKTLWGNNDVWHVFNSRDLICLLLSADKKYRDYEKNILYNQMIQYMTPELKGIPVNPYFKGRIIKLMKALRIYKIYKHIQYLIK